MLRGINHSLATDGTARYSLLRAPDVLDCRVLAACTLAVTQVRARRTILILMTSVKCLWMATRGRGASARVRAVHRSAAVMSVIEYTEEKTYQGTGGKITVCVQWQMSWKCQGAALESK